MHCRKVIIAVSLLLALSCAVRAQDAIPDGFIHPDKSYYPETWFHFIDGNVDKDGITKDLEAIAGAGISGIQLFHGGQFGGDWPGVKQHIECLSPMWSDAVAHTASEAKRLGLRFTMQNCPGWSLAGGPWVELSNAMRVLTCSRTDVTGGCRVTVSLPVTVSADEADWRDYKDITVLAFPVPEGDIDGPAVPERVEADCLADKWMGLLSGERSDISLAPCKAGNPHVIEIWYDVPTTVRSISFSSVQQFNHHFCGEPGVSVTVTACPDGVKPITVLDSPMPMSCWQDDKDMTFALDECTARKFVVSIMNEHDMNISKLQLLSAARKNNWEAAAAWTLRAVPYAGEYPEQSEGAFVRRNFVLDISDRMTSDGNLVWDAPEGRWTVLRIGHVNAGYKNAPAPKEATGWECDKLSYSGADAHFAGYIGKLAEGPVKGKLDAMLIDSWECNSQTWTADMEKDFREYNGYELRGWMPALFGYVMDSHETTSKMLRDWRACINDLFVNRFWGRMSENARKAGLGFVYETAAGDIFPADILEYNKYSDMMMCEFWNNPTPTFVGSFNFKPVKPTASAAHIYGRKRVAAESLTSFDLTWDEHFSRLKDLVNQNFAQGVTYSVFHTYTHNPCADTLVPGTSFGSGIGTPFLRGQTWWKHMPAFTSYLARLSYMLENGNPVADVLWYLGDGSMHKPDQNCEFPAGFKYDYCNQDVLLHRLSVRDGRIVTPEGVSYSVLWMPDNSQMLPATAARIRELVEAGATVIGEAPRSDGTLVVSADVPSANGVGVDSYEGNVAAVWGSGVSGLHHVGKGRVVSGMELQDALAALGLNPDLVDALSREDIQAGWLHRRDADADWYFIAAPLGQPFCGTVDIASSGAVSICDPVSGRWGVPVKSETDGVRTKVEISLPYAGSCFLYVDHSACDKRDTAAGAAASGAGIVRREVLDKDWTLAFPEGWGAPARMTLDNLVFWKDLPISEEGKAFSGTATYTRKLKVKHLDKDASYILDLGIVDEVARVFVNGKEQATLWCEPYSVDVTEALRRGTNELKIEVTSTWFNRLVYDAGLPEAERKTWVISGPDADEPLRQSGLLGPVILTEKK